MMRETSEDIDRLQRLLDESYARAGAHLTSIHSPAARLSAADLVGRLDGMQILVLATVTKDGRPRTGPVDGFLFRGQWRFGTAASAIRARHIARSPAVSATHVRGEALVVTVHGIARQIDIDGDEAEFGAFLREHYPGFDEWGSGAPYYAVDAERMFAADMSVHTPST